MTDTTPATLAASMADQPLLPGLLMAGGVLLAVIVMLRQWKKTSRKTNDLDRDPRERLEELHERARARREAIDDASADAEELTRRLAATLDNKAARIEVLLERAESVLARLEHAPPPSHPAGASNQGATLSAADVHRLADAGRTPAEIARELDHPVGQIELILNLRRSG